MKIERIGENKLKVTIPVSYFIERNIDFENFDYTSEPAQQFFCELMETLETDYGFSFLNSQMVIESNFGNSDDIVFTLTRPDVEQDGTSILHKYLNKKRKERLSEEDAYVDSCANSRAAVFEFENFDDLCNMVEDSGESYKIFNSLYKLNGSYYLVLDRKKINTLQPLFASLNEFSRYVTNSGFCEGYLNEYGELLMLGNALDVVKTYFC